MNRSAAAANAHASPIVYTVAFDENIILVTDEPIVIANADRREENGAVGSFEGSLDASAIGQVAYGAGGIEPDGSLREGTVTLT
jgi:hypothetical protein